VAGTSGEAAVREEGRGPVHSAHDLLTFPDESSPRTVKHRESTARSSYAEQRRRLAHEGKELTRDALRGLKIEIGRTTVASLLGEAGMEPAPERIRKRTWKQVLKSHWETLYACDFFSVETLGVFGTVRYLVFFVIEVHSRAVEVAGVRIAPDGEWMKQIGRNLFDPVDGFLRHATHLIYDRDPVFTAAWTALLRTNGVQCFAIPAQSPNCNPHAERFVKTVRTECLDHFVIFGERHLRHLLKDFVGHHVTERYHQGGGSQIIRPSVPPSNDNAELGRIARRFTPRRTAQLLLPDCRLTSGGEIPDITSFRTGRGRAPRRSLPERRSRRALTGFAAGWCADSRREHPMTHREFLIWLQSDVESAAGTGLARDGVRAIRDRLEQMRESGALQPFASKVLGLVRDGAALDAKTIASLAAEVRAELSPPREKTIVAATKPGEFGKSRE